MKKIPTLFKRVIEGHKIVEVLPEVTQGCEDALTGELVPTVKIDGCCCAIIDGKFYKRYDAKKGRGIPENAIKCQEDADPITGHLPCWVPVDENNASDKWFIEAYNNFNTIDKNKKFKYYDNNKNITGVDLRGFTFDNRTFEAIGKHFQGNPYNLDFDILVPHGSIILRTNACEEVITFEGIKKFLTDNYIEGLVYWDISNNKPVCKIKRTDFGLEWNGKSTKR